VCAAGRKNSGECRVSVGTRKKCAFCRYQKCKRVGMKHMKRPQGSSNGGRPVDKKNVPTVLVPSVTDVLTAADGYEIARLVDLNKSDSSDATSAISAVNTVSGDKSLSNQFMQFSNEMMSNLFSAFCNAAENKTTLDMR
jgi:hypothetical protein